MKNFRKFVFEKIKSPDIWYHGSKSEFDKFRLKKGILLDSDYISPIFLTSDYEFAKANAGYKTPHVYKVEILTDKIFDVSDLPNDLELYEVEWYGKPKKLGLDYELGLKLSEYIDSIFSEKYDTATIYNNIVSGDYSSIERDWFYDWLKDNSYDGCYIYETGSLNCFIFDPDKLRIIGEVTSK